MTYEWWDEHYKEVNDGESVVPVSGPDDVVNSKDKWRFRETIQDPYGNSVDVSTVFLGIDHRFADFEDAGLPILYETMIFGGTHDQDQWRYCTRAEAMKGHEAAKALVLGDKERRKKDRRKS